MKTSVIPIFIPHIGCPYRCVFCNQWQITGHRGVPDAADVQHSIDTYTAGVTEPRHWEVAFYGGSFTAIPTTLQEQLLQPAYEALATGHIQAVRCSTRPDFITQPILDRLRSFGMTIVELGVQSMDDRVLELAKRGHTAAHVLEATALLRANHFTVGHQLMPGLPGENWDSLKQTTAAVCRLHPDMARIYPVAVLDHTELADMYRAGRYKALTVHEGVERAAYMKQAFLEHTIQCIRTGLQATKDLDDSTQVLAGAYAPAMGELVDTRRYGQQLFALLDILEKEPIMISYHRRDTSRVRGYRNVTLIGAGRRYGNQLQWREDSTVMPGCIQIGTASQGRYEIYTDMRMIKKIECST
ncbi:elongator complex protein 3 [Megasphaera cerevisiae]|jgi:histone acetyltransferase (RNA polymerase elongator complex component)|uniref:elongator complex protein 3 n=1 Tax=Megasphaera cerevisiae TaxID=39029 RepID=UPI000942A6F6|nr:radical SAM protein [Megasphaera cerevisiae]MCI1750515.1 radical SAM protein [Megasphaera cerevisiae]OKY54012.1 radical SAM protein [Megasphaera cerevisiae]